MILIKNLNKTYNIGKKNEFKALNNVTISINSGEMVAIMGKSGAGKSTLMHVIGCIDDYEDGSYILNGMDISKMDDAKKATIRNRQIGIVMQDFALVEDYTSMENVMIPTYFSKGTSAKQNKTKAINAMKKLGILDLANKCVSKLSGGEKQRVAIARAIVNEPGILLADEPTGALDVSTSKEIISIIKELNQKGMTVIIITHDIDVARECTRIIEISDGNILT